MQPSNRHTAIVLFTRSAVEESRHKRFSNRFGSKGNVAIAQALTDHTTQVARNAGVDFITFGSEQQVGATFGERITHALASTFQRGYEKLIIVGNDCPSLNGAAIQQAVRFLEAGNAVVGPARDGGVYLIGISRAHFQSDAWLGLPWKEANLGDSLLGYLRQFNAPVHTLPLLSDIDNEHDLARVLRQKNDRAVFIRLRRLLATRAASLPVSPTQATSAVLLAAIPHRGPPSR